VAQAAEGITRSFTAGWWRALGDDLRTSAMSQTVSDIPQFGYPIQP